MTSLLLLTSDCRQILLQNQRSIRSLLTTRSGLCHRPITVKHSRDSEKRVYDRANDFEHGSEILRLRSLGTSSESSEVLAGGRSKSTVASIMLSEDAKWPKRIGLRARCVYYWNFYQSTYSIRLFLDFPQILGQRVLAFETTVRTNTLSWNMSRFLYGSLGTPMTVDCQSPLMSACAKGDLNAARDLIESRRANLSDRRGSCSCKVWECRSHEGDTALFVSPLLVFTY